MKERIDKVLRFIAVGYPLIFVFACLMRIIDPYNSFAPIEKLLFGRAVRSLMDFNQFPFEPIIATALLFGIRWIVSGKTYQK